MNKKVSWVTVGICVLILAGTFSTAREIPVSPGVVQKRVLLQDTITLHFADPCIRDRETYVDISMEGANARWYHPSEPNLPIYTGTMSFPFGTKIIAVDCTLSGVQYLEIPKKIRPTPPVSPLDSRNHALHYTESPGIYESSEMFPGPWSTHQISVGLEGVTHVVFLTFQMYPFQYYPQEDLGGYVEEMTLRVTYETPEIPLVARDEYDLVIIAPETFSDNLKDFIYHKEGYGMKTYLVTTEEIYRDYAGRDDAERIKYFIKDAVERWGVHYVLLVGGMTGQRLNSWYVPVRYTHLDDNSSWESTYISDLYYADLYKYQEGDIVFDDWDSNGNSIYAEWTPGQKDILDLHPDVYVGRLPCRRGYEVDIMVEKIMRYETTTYGQDWFNRMIVIGGDSFPDQNVGTDYLEGQLTCDEALKYMAGFIPTRLYVEGGDEEFTPGNTENILSQGAGFVYFSGHGNPMSWATHPHNDFTTWIDFGIKNIRNLHNEEKLPVLIVGGCHNSQFNVSIFRFLTSGLMAYYKGETSPECWGWVMTRKVGGGSIATMGNTGLGYGSVGDGPVDEVYDSVPDGIPDCIQYMGGWIESHFFEVYQNQGKKILGETWGVTVTDYVNRFPIDWSRDWVGERPDTGDMVDCKTAQEWVLFGDPSLRIGGYP